MKELLNNESFMLATSCSSNVSPGSIAIAALGTATATSRRTALKWSTGRVQLLYPREVKVAQGSVLDHVVEEGIGLLFQASRRRERRGGRQPRRVGNETGAEAHPRRYLVITRGCRMLPEFDGGLPSGNKVLDVELVVPRSAAVHDIGEVGRGSAAAQNAVDFAIGHGALVTTCCGTTGNRRAVALEVPIALVAARATRGREEAVHDALVFDKVLTDLDKLWHGQVANVNVNVIAHAFVDLDLSTERGEFACNFRDFT